MMRLMIKITFSSDAGIKEMYELITGFIKENKHIIKEWDGEITTDGKECFTTK